MSDLDRYREGWDAAIDTAIKHVEWQHVVWDMTTIPPRELLLHIAKNLRALSPDSSSAAGGEVK